MEIFFRKNPFLFLLFDIIRFHLPYIQYETHQLSSISVSERIKNLTKQRVNAIMKRRKKEQNLYYIFTDGKAGIRELKPMKHKNLKRKAANFLFAFFLILTLISGTFVIKDLIAQYHEKIFWENIQNKKKSADTPAEKQNSPTILPEYQTLYETNPDMVGWIKIDGTKIDYPVMQTKTKPQFYLRKNFEKKEDDLGTPFADYRCSILDNRSFNVIIYGHYAFDDSMFRWLLNYEAETWYQDHKTILFDTIREKGKYEIVAAFYYDAADAVLRDPGSEHGKDSYTFYNYIELDSKKGFEKFKSGIEKLKLYQTTESIQKEDSLITLVCCAPVEFSGIEETGRFVIVAKKMS